MFEQLLTELEGDLYHSYDTSWTTLWAFVVNPDKLHVRYYSWQYETVYIEWHYCLDRLSAHTYLRGTITFALYLNRVTKRSAFRMALYYGDEQELEFTYDCIVLRWSGTLRASRTEGVAICMQPHAGIGMVGNNGIQIRYSIQFILYIPGLDSRCSRRTSICIWARIGAGARPWKQLKSGASRSSLFHFNWLSKLEILLHLVISAKIWQLNRPGNWSQSDYSIKLYITANCRLKFYFSLQCASHTEYMFIAASNNASPTSIPIKNISDIPIPVKTTT